ncbi:MAG: hypothetical protein B6A08_18210, partial [Sorangiineae bacterium NIC37A_2]
MLLGRLVIGLGLAAGLITIGLSLRRARLSEALSAALDESFRGRGALGSAVWYLEKGPRPLDPFQALVVAEASAALSNFDLKEALPLGFRIRHGATLLSALCLIALASVSVEVPSSSLARLTPEWAQVGAPRLPDQVFGASEEAPLAPEALLLEARELEKFLESASPDEGFERLASLERRLADAELDRQRLIEELVDRGNKLAGKGPLERLAASLQKGDLEDARKALEALAERLSDPKQTISKEELAALRRAIERAQAEVPEATGQPEAGSGASPASAEPSSRETGEAQEKDGESGAQREQNAKQGRKLERLGGRGSEKSQARRELSELDRQLAEAMRELQQDRESAARKFAEASETMGKLAQRELTDDQKRELLEALRKMKEKLQDKSRPKEEQQALDEFRKRARGQGDESSEEEGRQGQGEEQASLTVSLEVAPESALGQGSEGGPGERSAEGNKSGSGTQPGKEHSPELEGAATAALPTQGGDRVSVAPSQEEGGDQARAVAGAARRGFTSAEYRALFQEYDSAREEALERDRVPSGYRTRVLRYFELIRPQAP